MEKDARDSADVCKQLEKEYPWIGSEKRLFGRPGSDYDWTARDPEAAFAEYKKLEDTLQGLSKSLNKRVRARGFVYFNSLAFKNRIFSTWGLIPQHA